VFKSLDLNVPEVYFISESRTSYFIEDFGDDLLLGIVEKTTKKDGFNNSLTDLYKKSLSALARMQVTAASYIDFSRTYSIREFNTQSILFDLNYFKYYFLNRSGINYDEKLLQDDFESFSQKLSSEGWKFFMFRDFQARNIIIKDNEPYFIDYQGGRLGAPEYDVASLLYQAKALIPEAKKAELLEFYFFQLSSYVSLDREEFYSRFYSFVYVRVLQTLGAYGLRGLIEKKQHFVESIPYALKNLGELLNSKPMLDVFPELNRVLHELSALKSFENIVYPEFTISVSSFSYKKGIPEDPTGNGGGFVFDCRGIHNPGRYAEFKTKTGRDKEVIDFFKDNSDIDDYVANAIISVKTTIDSYVERGFNSLMISFGCTGGQHRSVYCAEQMTKFVRETYKLKVNLHHREMGIRE
jgi:aminoglycoside/choline kinase family phosphotransferase